MNIELQPGNVKQAMRDANAGSRDLWQVPIADIKVMDGFNVRTQNADYQARIAYLADLILANGFAQNKPLAGYVALIDGKQAICLTDGHRRLAAAQLAITRGAEIEALPVVVSPKGTGIEDLTIGLVTMNDGEPLSQYEIGLVCKRLIGFGMDEKTIAKRLGMATSRVNDLLTLVAAPPAVRKLVAAGSVSASQAIATVKKHGPEATARLEAGVAKATEAGAKKATAKHIDAKPTHRAVVRALLKWDEAGQTQNKLAKIIDMARESES